MQRRSFLLATATLALSQILSGCNSSEGSVFNVQLLKGSIPVQVIDKFRQIQTSTKLKFSPVKQLQDAFDHLSSQQNPKDNDSKWNIPIPGRQSAPNHTDLATLGDYWLINAITEKLIQPLEVEKIPLWSGLSPKWQKLVTRNSQGYVDPQGKVWAVPYRWGSTVIIYNRDKFASLGWKPVDWGDLWHEDVRDRLSLLDNSREVVGLVLKKLGKSYNTENLATVTDLNTQLQQLDRQVKFYTNDNYLEPLIMGDTWLAVGWSHDITAIIARYPQLAIAIPSSGTALWADVWVKPNQENTKDLSYEWINFCLTPRVAREIVLRTKTNSPVSPQIKPSEVPPALNNLLLTNPDIFKQSEFLLPLPPQIAKQYDALFAAIRS